MPEQQELFFVYNKPPEDRLPNKERMRVDEVAKALDYSEQHIRNLIEIGELDAFDGSRDPGVTRPSYRIFTASVRDFMKKRREGAH